MLRFLFLPNNGISTGLASALVGANDGNRSNRERLARHWDRLYHFVIAVWRAKASVFPAKNRVDSVPVSFAVSHRAKLFRRLPRELHLTFFPQGNQ